MAINIYFFQTNIIIIHHSWCSSNGLDFDIVRLRFAMLQMTFVYTIRRGAFLKLLEESDVGKKWFCPLGLKTNVFHGSRHLKMPSPLGIFLYIDVAPKSMMLIQYCCCYTAPFAKIETLLLQVNILLGFIWDITQWLAPNPGNNVNHEKGNTCETLKSELRQKYKLPDKEKRKILINWH